MDLQLPDFAGHEQHFRLTSHWMTSELANEASEAAVAAVAGESSGMGVRRADPFERAWTPNTNLSFCQMSVTIRRQGRLKRILLTVS